MQLASAFTSRKVWGKWRGSPPALSPETPRVDPRSGRRLQKTAMGVTLVPCSTWSVPGEASNQSCSRHVCDRHHSSRRHRIRDPRSEAGDRAHILMAPSQVLCCRGTGERPRLCVLNPDSLLRKSSTCYVTLGPPFSWKPHATCVGCCVSYYRHPFLSPPCLSPQCSSFPGLL